VSSDPGVWGWTGDVGRLGFTVTFSLGRTAEEVLSLYGADVSEAEELSRDGAWIRYPPNLGGAQLRAGTLGRWGFCFEEAGFEGFKARTLSGLSADTETISFFMSEEGRSSFIFLKDSEGIEAFEPDAPNTLRGDAPCKFWNDTQRILELANQTAPMLPAHAVLRAITKHIRGPLDRATLEGHLLTAFLPDAYRAPMGADFDDAATPRAAQPDPPAPEPQYEASQSFPTSWDTGPIPVIPAPPTPPAPGGSYDPVYSRFSRAAQAS
jgi:hypothetical protein